jgi:hypothetical protein
VSEAVAAAYFACWLARDFDGLRALLADDVTFEGPLGAVDGAAACVDGLRGLGAMLEGIDVERVFVDRDDVLTWYTLRTKVAAPVAVANWMRIEDGRITRIRVAFDATDLRR